MAAPTPTLHYTFLTAPGDDITGDGPELHTVFEVSVSRDRATGGLSVWARGRMRRKDGEPGPSRGRSVDVDADQPGWLRDIIDDARQRLNVR